MLATVPTSPIARSTVPVTGAVAPVSVPSAGPKTGKEPTTWSTAPVTGVATRVTETDCVTALTVSATGCTTYWTGAGSVCATGSTMFETADVTAPTVLETGAATAPTAEPTAPSTPEPEAALVVVTAGDEGVAPGSSAEAECEPNASPSSTRPPATPSPHNSRRRNRAGLCASPVSTTHPESRTLSRNLEPRVGICEGQHGPQTRAESTIPFDETARASWRVGECRNTSAQAAPIRMANVAGSAGESPIFYCGA